MASKKKFAYVDTKLLKEMNIVDVEKTFAQIWDIKDYKSFQEIIDNQK